MRVQCGVGRLALGGGVQHNFDSNAIVERSVAIELDGTTPEGNERSTGWLGRARGTGGASTGQVAVFVVCANAP